MVQYEAKNFLLTLAVYNNFFVGLIMRIKIQIIRSELKLEFKGFIYINHMTKLWNLMGSELSRPSSQSPLASLLEEYENIIKL